MPVDLSRVVRDLVNHFKAEMDNAVEMARQVVENRGLLGDTTTCLYLLSIGNFLLQLVNDAVLFTGVVRKDIVERVTARVLLIRADSRLIDVYVERGWATQDQANLAKEALRAEEDKIGEVYSEVSQYLNQAYDELVNYGRSKFSEFAQLYNSVGCQAILVI